ncbi:hypothetical protein HMPREF1881_01456 [Streptococcus agalactiae]|nr:hypothetical protein HMPREF1881_01456 [Streptococcus agalactiae]
MVEAVVSAISEVVKAFFTCPSTVLWAKSLQYSKFLKTGITVLRDAPTDTAASRPIYLPTKLTILFLFFI